jgi:hypothetical protein
VRVYAPQKVECGHPLGTHTLCGRATRWGEGAGGVELYILHSIGGGKRGENPGRPCEKINVFRIYSYLQLACKICTL